MGDTSENMRYDFFVSFASDAKEWVYGVLVPKLGRTGKRFALEGQELTGQFWLNDLQKNIEQSHTVLLILSPQYLTSERTELIKQMALLKVVEQRQWRVIPILLKSVERELVMRVIDGIDLTKNYENEDRLNDLLGGQLPSLDEQAYLATPPYPGMQAFTEKEAGWFFGREDEVDQYVKMLCDQQIVVLTGASGCGKSSLARAGIVPILEAKKQFVVKIIRPNHLGLDGWLEQAENALKHGDDSTKQFFSLKQPDQSFLLLIDQFEELFSTESDERSNFILSIRAKQFLSFLVKLKKQVPNFYLLITLRAEFYPQLALCQAYLDFDNYLQRVNALSREGLTNAITKPALKKYVYIDERLVERLVSETGDDPGILPFVQETLRDLWEKRYENYIGLEAYESLGGNTGSGLKASIAAKADAAYKALISIDKEHRLEKENITKRIFLRLIQFGEGKPDTRRQQSILDLRSDQDTQGVFEETLRHLSSEKYRLLTVSRGDGDDDSKVDIVHEALIVAWPRLGEWISSSKNIEQLYRYINYQSERWVKNSKNELSLLNGLQLKELKLKWLLIKENGVSNQVELFWMASIKYDNFLFYKQGFKYISLLFGFVLFVYLIWIFYVFLIKKSILNELVQISIDDKAFSIKIEDEFINNSKNIRINKFLIDKYEVNNASICKCIKTFNCKLGGVAEICNEKKGNLPVVNISLADAQDFCMWIDRRLPLEVEWEKAASDINFEEILNQPYINEFINTTDIRLDKTRADVYGFYSNVSEWTLSEYKKGEFLSKNIWNNKSIIDNVTIKGSNFDFIERKPYYFRIDRDHTQGYSDVGFRCVKAENPEVVLSKIMIGD